MGDQAANGTGAFALTDRVAIVTGGASGIGRACARRLAALGAAVVVADLNADGAAAVAADIDGGGHQSLAVELDVTRADDTDRLAETTVARFGRIDALIHSAGIGVERPFLEMSADEWTRIVETDLTGTFLTCQAVARAMAAHRYGRIVTLASTAGLRGGTGRAAYGAAKGGVIALTKVMAVELAPMGITANALAPGAIETELVARMHSAETRTVYRRGIPADRYGTPEEVADVAAFLVSDEARYVTGQVVGIDGGFLAAGIINR